MTKTLLLVEDSPTQAAGFKTHFETLGYPVVVTRCGVQGLAMLTELTQLNRTPLLVVLDYRLPLENGIEICRRIKQTASFRIVPVVIYSECAQPERMRAAYEAGVDYWLVKEGLDGLARFEQVLDALQQRGRRKQSGYLNGQAFTSGVLVGA